MRPHTAPIQAPPLRAVPEGAQPIQDASRVARPITLSLRWLLVAVAALCAPAGVAVALGLFMLCAQLFLDEDAGAAKRS